MNELFKKRYTKETEIGKQYGHLKIIDFFDHAVVDGRKIRARAFVECQNCDSKPYVVSHGFLTCKKEGIRSCGCINLGRTSHGLRRHPYYNSCCSAIGRCKPNHFQHQYYYDRGIQCYWTMETIGDFIKYLEGNLPERQERESLDRIDNDRGYEPGNLRWASKSEQTLNRRRMITNHEFDALGRENERLVAEVLKLRQQLELAYLCGGVI